VPPIWTPRETTPKKEKDNTTIDKRAKKLKQLLVGHALPGKRCGAGGGIPRNITKNEPQGGERNNKKNRETPKKGIPCTKIK